MLRLRTLGGLAIERPGASPSGGATSARRRLSVLAVIAAAAPRGVPRDKLLTIFWPESDMDRARHALDQALHWLRRDLKTDALILGREELSLNPEVITSDIGEFRLALAREDFAAAVELYQGPFLDGVFISDASEFDHWVDEERAAVMRDVERALERLAAAAAARGDHRGAAQWWQRLAAMDPRKTRVVMALMSELAASGDRAGALQRAEIYRTLVREDLELEPNPAVDALVDRLRHEPPASPPAAAPLGTSDRLPSPALANHPPSLHRHTDLFAGRYVIQRELGRGTSATVYLARDVHNDRMVALKILRPELAAEIAHERFRQEITVTANLQHPHILPIHDSGEAEGSLYFVMPYVEGESLRERLERSPQHRLPVEEAVRIAREIADALAYAHRRGIVHRDVKPENVMLTSDHAVVCDFGLARALDAAPRARKTGPGLVVGTPAYLSPERATTGDEGDAYSDQYSLGCVLYEVLAGARPFASDDLVESMRARSHETPPPLDTVRSDVPRFIAAAVQRALSPEPAERFPDVAAFGRALTTPALSNRARRVRWAAAGALVLIAVIAVALATRRVFGRAAVADRSFIVLADIENRTRDSVFDHAIDAVIAAGLRQSTRIDLFPADRVRQTLARMDKSLSQVRQSSGSARRFDEALAREVAQREGIPALIVGSIDRVDTNYIINERLVDAAKGTTLASESAVAKGRASIIEAADAIVRQLRRDIGESSDALARHDRPLPLVTTRSLDALRRYADGLAAAAAGQGDQASDHFRNALALDSDFALAHAELGIQLYYANSRVEGDRHFDRALQLLDRLTDRERIHVQAAVEEWRGSRERAIALYRTLLAEYPGDPGAWGSIGFNLMRLRRPREAVPALLKQIARDSGDVIPYVNLSDSYAELADYERQLGTLRKIFVLRAGLFTNAYLNENYGKALLFTGHSGEARTAFDSMLTGNSEQRGRGERSIAMLEMVAGHFDTAIVHLRQAIALTHRPGGSMISEGRNRLFLAAAQMEKGQGDSARAQLGATYRLFRTTSFEPAFLMFLGKALVRAGELRLATEVLDTLRRRARATNPVDQANLQVLTAEVKLAHGSGGTSDSEGAVSLLQQALAADSSAFVSESLARALASEGDRAQAAARYEAVGSAITQWYGWEAQSYALSALVEAAHLYEGMGDTTRARIAYERHLARLGNGDTDLVSVREARAGLRRLSGARAAAGIRSNE